MGAQSFNRYNIFYRLERHLLLKQRGAVPEVIVPSAAEAKKWEALELPPLPSRYQGLDIPRLWFLSSKGSDKKRSHRKSHGVASFSEIARIVASNWKAIDGETMNYVTNVSMTLKAYTEEHGITSETPQPKAKRAKRGDETIIEKKQSTTIISSQEAPSVEESMLPMPSLPKITSPLLPISGVFDARSDTPQASNRTSNEGQLASSALSPASPSPVFSSGSDEVISNMEQSFLREVLGADAAGGTDGAEEPRTVTSLLAMMTTGPPSGHHPTAHHRLQRSKTFPPPGGTLGDAELQRRRLLFQSHQRRPASTSSIYPNLGHHHIHRRASMGSYDQPVKELDIADDEILRMWTNPNHSGNSGSSSSPENEAKTAG